ncbi:hypothetical protein [Bradyrhizobium sp. CB2312]|uniref:hypothetical protein n=1 Tax=Bradyrhizobium sp. CB2312 TaxID=3039155 RepID=UPI0024B1202C|nr:hypothetical protein [Bradyrhizobium sp. CB2312]WFU68581.1 hypothetical protein QA642_24965 [Bradyrhizobium sp. CB2312]
MSVPASTNCAVCPHQADCQKLGTCLDEINTAQLATRRSCPYPTLMTPAQVLECMKALQDGLTLRRITGGGKAGKMIVSLTKFKAHCVAYPEWGADAMRLVKANAKAADALKSPKLYKLRCKHGHSLALRYTYRRYGYVCRGCRGCDRHRNANAGVLKPGQIERATAALRNGATINQIIHGRPTGGKYYDRKLILIHPSVFYRYRRANPEYNRLVLDVLEARICLRNPTSIVAAGTFQYVWDPADAHAIPAMIPDGFPGKNDVVQSIFVGLIEGRLDRAQLKQHIRWFLKDYNRQHPGKFAKFGSGRLVSLDEARFEDGSGTIGDNVTRGLWD